MKQQTVTQQSVKMRIGPAKKTAWKSPKNSWAGKASISGDIVNADMSSLWEAVRPE